MLSIWAPVLFVPWRVRKVYVGLTGICGRFRKTRIFVLGSTRCEKKEIDTVVDCELLSLTWR
jgi:hypothetical protein